MAALTAYLFCVSTDRAQQRTLQDLPLTVLPLVLLRFLVGNDPAPLVPPLKLSVRNPGSMDHETIPDVGEVVRSRTHLPNADGPYADGKATGNGVSVLTGMMSASSVEYRRFEKMLTQVLKAPPLRRSVANKEESP